MSTSTGSDGPPRDPDHTQPLPRAPREQVPQHDTEGAAFEGGGGQEARKSGGARASDTRRIEAREPEYAHAPEPDYGDRSREPEYAGERAPRYTEQPAYQDDRRYAGGQDSTTLPRDEDFYSGVKIGSAFYGWLTATAMFVLISAVAGAIGASVAVATRTTTDDLSATVESDPQTSAIVSGIVVVLVMFLAYYCGGYVAGRMARFDGVRQGVAVWCWGLLMTLLLWLTVFLVGDRWDPMASIEGLATFDVPVSPTSTTGLVMVGAVALIALLAAIFGAVVGVRYHRRIDEAVMSA